jgi:hypothetical protein
MSNLIEKSRTTYKGNSFIQKLADRIELLEQVEKNLTELHNMALAEIERLKTELLCAKEDIKKWMGLVQAHEKLAALKAQSASEPSRYEALREAQKALIECNSFAAIKAGVFIDAVLNATPQPAQSEPVAYLDVGTGVDRLTTLKTLPEGRYYFYATPQPAQSQPVKNRFTGHAVGCRCLSCMAPQPSAEDAKDAARYRWLRDEHYCVNPVAAVVWKLNQDRKSSRWVHTVDGNSLDAAIDQAMQKGGA